jgi:hypothetical protein
MGETGEIRIDAAKRYLSDAGLDLVVDFNLADYNGAIAGQSSLVPLLPFGGGHTRALVVANTRALWHNFVAALEEDPALRGSADPLDDYVSSRLVAAAAMLHCDTKVYTAEMDQDPLVSMVAAGSVAGLGVLGPAMMLVHPIHGPWIGIRGVIALNARPISASTVAVDHCVDCSAPCKTALDDVLLSMNRPTVDLNNWRRWLAVREACPVGTASEYGPNQTAYHYTKNRAALAFDSE